MGDAGIVDENIDLADGLLRLFGELHHGGAVAKIARQHMYAVAELLGQRVELFLPRAGDRDIGALSMQRLRHGGADPTARSGDQRALRTSRLSSLYLAGKRRRRRLKLFRRADICRL